MRAVSHWRKVPPYYLKVSPGFSLLFWVLPLAVGIPAMLFGREVAYASEVWSRTAAPRRHSSSCSVAARG